MDIQKEREAFEKQENIRIFVKQCLFDEQLNEYSSKTLHDYTLGFINGAWWTWQAAKAQAVPEGFVLVPKEPTPKMIDSTWDYFEDIEGMSHNKRNEFIYKAMIDESQEPK